jgi:hypothetical protein
MEEWKQEYKIGTLALLQFKDNEVFNQTGGREEKLLET